MFSYLPAAEGAAYTAGYKEEDNTKQGMFPSTLILDFGQDIGIKSCIVD